MKNNLGLTLVEVMVVMAIFLLMAAGMHQMLIAAQKIWGENSAVIDLEQNLRKATTDISDDLRQTGASALTSFNSGETKSTIEFKKPLTVTGGTIVWNSYTTKFQISGTNTTQLEKVENGVTSVVATDMQSVQFTRPSGTSDVISVNMVASKKAATGRIVQANTNFSIQLRNE